MTRLRARLAALAFGVLLAALLLGVVEVGLRVAGLGDDEPVQDPFAGFSEVIPTFVRDVDEQGVAIYRVASTRLGRRTREALASPHRRFLAKKPADGFRVFVVGGSSAAGVPYGVDDAFAAWLERLLTPALPDRRVEVVNAAFSGFASRRVLGVVRELAGYSPDLLVVYSGHNEFAESRFYRHLLDLDPRLFRLWEAVVGLRSYRLLSKVLPVPSPGDAPPVLEPASDESRALEMFAVASERATGEAEAAASEREAAYRELLYRFNLREMVAAVQAVGGRVMLASLGQNLSDWPPAASSHDPDLDAEALRAFDAAVADAKAARAAGDRDAELAARQRAVDLDPQYALAHFELARCLRARGDFDAAARHFQRASDLDRVPHGAPSAFNRVVAEVAAEQGAWFVDVAGALARKSGTRGVGDDLFVDMVHPNLAGQQAIARALVADLAKRGWPRGARLDPEAALPTPDALYAADPHLRFLEHQMRFVACRLALRDACMQQALAAMRALEPDNPLPAQLARTLGAAR